MSSRFLHIQAPPCDITPAETIVLLKELGVNVCVYHCGIGWVAEFKNTYIHGECLSDVVYYVWKHKNKQETRNE